MAKTKEMGDEKEYEVYVDSILGQYYDLSKRTNRKGKKRTGKAESIDRKEGKSQRSQSNLMRTASEGSLEDS